MTYLKPHNRPYRRNARIIGAAVIACLLLWIVVRLFLPGLLPSLADSVAVPFWRLEFSAQSGSFQSDQVLVAENEDLKRQIANLQVQNASIQSIEDQNSQLEALMGRDSSSTTPYTLAAVLARPPLSAYDELVIDIGTDYGLSTTSLVYAPGDVLIGRVSEALPHTSLVTLFSSPGQTYPVLVGASDAPATAVGRGGGQYQAQISRDITVSAGDPVISPGLGDRPLGVVSAVESNPADPFDTVLFAPSVNEYELRWVLVDATGKEGSNL